MALPELILAKLAPGGLVVRQMLGEAVAVGHAVAQLLALSHRERPNPRHCGSNGLEGTPHPALALQRLAVQDFERGVTLIGVGTMLRHRRASIPFKRRPLLLSSRHALVGGLGCRSTRDTARHQPLRPAWLN